MKAQSEHKKTGPKPGNRAQTVLNIKRAKKLKCLGWSYARIGREMGLSYQRIQQFLTMGLPTTKPDVCEDCRNPSEVMHRHHTSYVTNSIKWLCPKCHVVANKECGLYKHKPYIVRPVSRSANRLQFISGCMRLPTVIKIWRLESNLTLRDLESITGVSYVTLHRFERGHSIRHLELVKIWQWLLGKEKP